jgi:hypothetical protein
MNAAYAVHPDWKDHPVVATAIEKGGDAREILCRLSDALNVVDGKKKPKGRTMQEVLDASAERLVDLRSTRPEREAIRFFVEQKGMSVAAATEVVQFQGERIDNIAQLPPEHQGEIEGRMLDMREAGWPIWLIAKHVGMHRNSVGDRLAKLRCFGVAS